MEMPHTQNGYNQLCSCYEEVKRTTHDEGRKQIAIGHLSLLRGHKNQITKLETCRKTIAFTS